MKKYLVIIILLATLTGVYFTKSQKETAPKKIIHVPSPTIKAVVTEKKSLFVPQWNLTDKNNFPVGYDRLIYFSNTYLPRSLPIGNGEWWFTIKVSELPVPPDWSAIVKKNLDIAKNYNMAGIVLDLEISGLPTDEMVSQINKFVEYFYTQTKQHYIKLAVAVYGDTFYRRRPYDIRFISENSDEIMVMAYDFHKSRGEPGPNFPFARRSEGVGGIETQTYGYDFQRMITDFLTFVPAEKLTVVFGMFGYDWTVDEKKRPISPAKALTLNEIKKNFLEKCEWQDCVIKKDDISRETEIDYIISTIVNDYANLEYHIVWFEDEESAKVKLQYLKEKGIGSMAYWAYGYF